MARMGFNLSLGRQDSGGGSQIRAHWCTIAEMLKPKTVSVVGPLVGHFSPEGHWFSMQVGRLSLVITYQNNPATLRHP